MAFDCNSLLISKGPKTGNGVNSLDNQDDEDDNDDDEDDDDDDNDEDDDEDGDDDDGVEYEVADAFLLKLVNSDDYLIAFLHLKI